MICQAQLDEDDDKSIYIYETSVGSHAEEQMLRKLREKIHDMKTEKGEAVKNKLKITVYINNSPCSDCADKLLEFLKENTNAVLEMFVASLYKINRKSCEQSEHFHSKNYPIDKPEHKKNCDGLRKLMNHDHCSIYAYKIENWIKLLEIVPVTDEYKRNFRTTHRNERKTEDDNIKSDLDHICKEDTSR